MKLRSIITYAALTAICLVLFIPNLVYTFPYLMGADSSYTVMSGSMRPALIPGDLVIVEERESSAISVGDMITIRNEDFIFTHRVIEKLEDGLFRLKGDANEEPDMNLVDASQIIGVVTLVFPFGHLYTSYGFALALIAPAGLLIGGQMHRIYQFTKRRNKKETMKWRRNNRGKPMIGTSTLLLALILAVSTTRIVAPHLISGSGSYFSDTEWTSNSFNIGTWDIDAIIEIEPETLNLDSEGEWITVYALVDTIYDENDIVLSSVFLDYSIQAADGEVQEDGRLMVKFDRAQVIEYLSGYGDGEEVELTVSGTFKDGVNFSGVDTIMIRRSDG